MPSYDAMVLAGGTARRLGGADKAAIRVGEQTLLERALDAVAGAGKCVVVGPPRPLPPDVVRVSEEPPGSGPVAAIAAGLAEVVKPFVVVLACDMPLISRGHVEGLAYAAARQGSCNRDNHPAEGGSGRHVDGVLLVDEDGHRQPLAAVYRTDTLRRAIGHLDTTRDAPMRRLIADLMLVEQLAPPDATLDCDTWEGVARSRDLLEEL